MAIETINDAVQIVGALCATVAAFLLKHLHGKVQESVSKAELAEAMKKLAEQRLEDMQRAEQWRQERRDTENLIFERLGSQDKMLARIDERTARMTKP